MAVLRIQRGGERGDRGEVALLQFVPLPLDQPVFLPQCRRYHGWDEGADHHRGQQYQQCSRVVPVPALQQEWQARDEPVEQQDRDCRAEFEEGRAEDNDHHQHGHHVGVHATGRRQTDRIEQETAEDHRQKTFNGHRRPRPEPGEESAGDGGAGDDPFDAVVDLEAGADVVAGHHHSAQAPERQGGRAKRRAVQRRSTLDRTHAGEYNAAPRGFRHCLPGR